MRKRYYIFLLVMLQIVAFAGTDLLPQLPAYTADHPALYWEYSPIVNGQRTVTSHLQPIWHVDASGNYQRNVVDLQDDGTGYYETRMPIQFRADHDGRAIFKIGNDVLRLTPFAATVWDNSGGTLRERLATAPTEKLKQAKNFIRHNGALGDEAYFEYEVTPGKIKEYVTLPVVPTLPIGSKHYVLLWHYSSQTLTPEIIDSEIHWARDSGKTILRSPPPDVWDKNGNSLNAQYRIRGQYIATVMLVSELRTATYPVVVDPTVTTVQADTLANRDVYESDRDNKWQSAYMRFLLPDISGGSITAADIQLRPTGVNADLEFSVYCTDVSAQSGGEWTDSTGHAVLDAFTFDAATATLQKATVAGDKFYNITGSASNGITKAFDDAATWVTIKLDWTNGPAFTVNTTGTGLTLGDQGPGEDIISFQTRASSSFYPRLNITHEPAGGGGTPYYYRRRNFN